MCGIAGVFARQAHSVVDPASLRAMARVLAHRGPDGEGFRHGQGYGLVHRRLAIVDLDTGEQPMTDQSGRLWVVFNGEIYNHLELRAELEAAGYAFRTRSDTEVLLHGYRAWGEALPGRLRGMFAFALVDEEQDLLFAARDRVGKKPFHYAQTSHGLVFASEIKALLVAGTHVERTLDPEALAQFLCLRYVPDPRTVFSGVQRLPPAHAMVVRRGRTPRLWRYWSLSFAEEDRRDVDELREQTLALLDEATRIRLMSEVPLGAFLSGGVDSFAVVDSMARASASRVVACTIGFDDPRFDERAEARAAAAQCGATLHEDEVRIADMLEHGWFADTFDEPFADSSAVPTYHVSRLARRHVTVALAGDGGDEAFAGYRRYRFDVVENRIRRCLPGAAWRALGAVYPKADFLPRPLRFKRTLQNLGRDAAVAYARSVSASLPEEILPLLRAGATSDPLAPVVDAYRQSDARDALTRACATDFATWLPGDILVKVDRAAMANSLEVRAPFLDHHLLEFAARVPSRLKIRGGKTKAFLRSALRGRLGAPIEARKKQGFSVPLRAWMAGPVGDELAARLRDGPLAEFVHPDRAAELLRQHRSQLVDRSETLWALTVLGRFLQRWVDGPEVANRAS
ncbi:MAG: asparagine synthase (glutamine-hydrolyzing) [Planctomycetota bacterium]